MKIANQPCYLIVIYAYCLISKKKMVTLVVKLVKIFLFPSKVLCEDLVKRKGFFYTLHLHPHYTVVTRKNRNSKLSSSF